MHKKFTYIVYQIIMAILAVISIGMLIAYYAKRINIDAYPYNMIDNGIWLAFFTDYVIRLIISPNKREFVKDNIFDLLSIGQIGRTFQMLKLMRIMRLVGFTGRLGVFFERNELLYYLYITIAVIMVAAAMFCISEKVSYETALWWAITTATTIGYGDVIPKTGIGRAAAIVLMLLGIGFIGMLTSTITEFFAKKDERKISAQLVKIQHENRQLKAELDEIKRLIQKNNH